MLRSQQRFRSETNSVFTEKADKIVLSINNNKNYKHLMEQWSCGVGTERVFNAKDIYLTGSSTNICSIALTLFLMVVNLFISPIIAIYCSKDIVKFNYKR